MSRTGGNIYTVRTIGLAIAVAIVLVCPLSSYASYRIQLKNGSEWVTNAYRQSADTIEFRVSGGMVTLSNSLVRAIDESDEPYVEAPRSLPGKMQPEVAVERSGAIVHTTHPPTPGEKESITPAVTRNGKLDLAYYSRKNNQLKDRLDEALKQMRASKSEKGFEEKKSLQPGDRKKLQGKEGTQTAERRGSKEKRRAQTEARRISRLMYDLTDEVKKHNDGELPDDWWQHAKERPWDRFRR
ncbi:MAG: hypothetical protein V3S89_13745 [Desulfobacterales bacterium]